MKPYSVDLVMPNAKKPPHEERSNIHNDFIYTAIKIDPKLVNPHNDFVSFAAQVGLIGFCLYYGLITGLLFFYWKLYRQTKNKYIVALLVSLVLFVGNGITDSNLQFTFSSPLALHVMIASFLLHWKGRYQKKVKAAFVSND